MQSVLETGYLALMGLAFFIIGTWMIGRLKTSKLRNQIAQDVASRFHKITSKVSVKLLGNTGAKFSYHQVENSPLRKLESTILLLDRSNIFHMVYCIARHRTDQLQIRTNLKKYPSFDLELTTLKEKKNLEDQMKLQSAEYSELSVENLTEPFYIMTNNLEAGEHLFQKSQFQSDFKEITPFLTRLSISKREPHLFASVKLIPEAMGPIEKFVTSLTSSLKIKR